MTLTCNGLVSYSAAKNKLEKSAGWLAGARLARVSRRVPHVPAACPACQPFKRWDQASMARIYGTRLWHASMARVYGTRLETHASRAPAASYEF